MNIWLFGDSFSQVHTWYGRETFHHEAGQWPHQLAKKTDRKLQPQSLSGSALDYTYYKFNQVRKDMKQRDIVVVLLTELNRRWFWLDKPEDGCPFAIELDKTVATAYKYYEAYLNNREVHNNHLLTFLYDLQGWSQFKHLQTVVIPCFKDVEEFLEPYRRDLFLIHLARGNLFDVSRNEFTPDIKNNPELFNYFCRNDLRLNHLIKSNHTILANKITAHLKDGMANPVDLRDGFVEGIISPAQIKSEDFSKLELFNAHITELWNKH